MSSDEKGWSMGFLKCCFPQRTIEPNNQTSSNPSARYNAKVRENLNLPQYPLKLPARVEYDRSGLVTIQPQAAPKSPLDVPPQFPKDPAQLPTPPPPSPPRKRVRFPFAVNLGADPRPSWNTAPLSPEQLARLFDAVAETLEHVPYAICGLAALVDHGCAARRVSRISILCPAYAKDNVKAWLAARGYDTYADSAGIPIPASGSNKEEQIVCRVRIKYLADGFENLERRRANMCDSAAAAWILGLASQLDHAAAGFVDHHRRFVRDRDEGRGDAARKSEQALRVIADDVFWLLTKAAQTRHRLEPRLLPTLLAAEFWDAFTKRYDNARAEMAAAGIDVAAVLARRNAEEELREHNAMLREFGAPSMTGVGSTVEGGVITRQPGMFEGMRTLANSKSMYTLKPGESSPTLSNRADSNASGSRPGTSKEERDEQPQPQKLTKEKSAGEEKGKGKHKGKGKEKSTGKEKEKDKGKDKGKEKEKEKENNKSKGKEKGKDRDNGTTFSAFLPRKSQSVRDTRPRALVGGKEIRRVGLSRSRSLRELPRGPSSLEPTPTSTPPPPARMSAEGPRPSGLPKPSSSYWES